MTTTLEGQDLWRWVLSASTPDLVASGLPKDIPCHRCQVARGEPCRNAVGAPAAAPCSSRVGAYRMHATSEVQRFAKSVPERPVEWSWLPPAPTRRWAW